MEAHKEAHISSLLSEEKKNIQLLQVLSGVDLGISIWRGCDARHRSERATISQRASAVRAARR